MKKYSIKLTKREIALLHMFLCSPEVPVGAYGELVVVDRQLRKIIS